MKRKTTEQFIKEARRVHNDKYDYSLTEYKNTHIKVCIICPIHGEFYQIPCDHLHKHGCPHCARESQKSLVHGVGINDLLYTRKTKPYTIWTSLLQRCYSNNRTEKHRTYKGCSVCQEWLTFSNFKSWFENPVNGYIDGYHLDKDIIIKGNKLYSPNTCCFIPQALNDLFTKSQAIRGELPIGVTKTSYNKYVAKVTTNRTYLGVYKTANEAFLAYKEAKEKIIKELAEKYFNEGKITERVYNAL